MLSHLNGNGRLRMSPIIELVREFSEGKPGHDPEVLKGLSAEFAPLLERMKKLHFYGGYLNENLGLLQLLT